MEMITISSRQGMLVTLSIGEYAEMLTKYGSAGAKYEILNTAGRVAKHRQILADFANQNLSDEQKKQVDALAMVFAIDHATRVEIAEMGYDNYISRADRGGMMPESWGRIVSQAHSRINEYEIKIDAGCIEMAMRELGFLTKRDSEWSERITSHCDWEIEVPDGWDQA